MHKSTRSSVDHKLFLGRWCTCNYVLTSVSKSIIILCMQTYLNRNTVSCIKYVLRFDTYKIFIIKMLIILCSGLVTL
jgi:hypothetical protein